MKQKIIIFLIVIIIFVPSLILFAPLLFNFNLTPNNTYLLDKNYSGLSRDQIYSRIDADFPLPEKILLKYEDREFELPLSTISASLNRQKTTDNLLARNIHQGLGPYLTLYFQRKNHLLEISFDQAALETYISNISAQINKPFIPTELVLNQNKITTKKGELGFELNLPAFNQELSLRLRSYHPKDPIILTSSSLGWLPDDSQILNTENKAKNLLGKSLTLKTPHLESQVDDKTLISWLDFGSGLNENKLNSFTTSTSDSFKQDPVDAIFKFENNKVLEFRPAKNGQVVDESQFRTLLSQSVNSLSSGTDKIILLEVPVIESEPSIKTEAVNNLGIKELLGRGVSTFKHSSTTRNFNVEKGASVVNRILVAPGDTFSFVKVLGKVTKETGYKDAYIIREGRTELDAGGGICQVSTTFFRALLNAGLDIQERQAHAYRVSYYEEDSAPGYDATVFVPKPDLSFVNDTGHHLLIQNFYDDKEKRLTYEIYGTSDGRSTEISNYRQWDSTPAPPDRYIDDPTLPAGQVVQMEHRVPGLKTSFLWQVTRDGQVLHQRTFQSSYVPWAAVYRRGPTL